MLDFVKSEACVLCDAACKDLLCTGCAANGAAALFALRVRQHVLERRHERVLRHCMQCCAAHERRVQCRSLDCSHLYARLRLEKQSGTAQAHCARAAAELGTSGLEW